MEIIDTTIAICINYRHKVIFVHIPKNAGTSIKTTFFPKHKYRIDLFHPPEDRDKEIAKYKALGFRTFTVWRTDVVDRFKTAYIEDVNRVDKDCHWMKDMAWYHEKKPKERFLAYLTEAENYGGFSHCIKQTDAVKTHDGTIRDFDYNFTMNTVDKIPSVLFNNCAMPKKQTNQHRKQGVDAFFTEDVVARIKNLYIEDMIHISTLMRDQRIWKPK